MRLISKQVRIFCLLVQYFYLHLCKIYLHIKFYFIKAAGAMLIEAVKIEYCIKSLSKEERITFAACVAVAIYALALVLLIRI